MRIKSLILAANLKMLTLNGRTLIDHMKIIRGKCIILPIYECAHDKTIRTYSHACRQIVTNEENRFLTHTKFPKYNIYMVAIFLTKQSKQQDNNLNSRIT